MKAGIRYFLMSIILSIGSLYADRLSIHNKTPRDLYIGIYYLGSKLPWEKEYPKAKLASEIKFLESESFGIIERPARKVGYDRELVFVEDAKLLKPELTRDEVLVKYRSKNVGDLQGDVFYIGDKDAEFNGYTTVEWNVVKPILEAARNKVMDSVPAIRENPYKNKPPAQVRVGNSLSDDEKAYLEKRLPKVKQALEKLLGKQINSNAVPKVALVCSGGGYRAMLFAVGAFMGAQEIGLLDSAAYMVGLSGSTWAIGGWIISGKPIVAYHDWLVAHINYGLKQVNTDDVKLIGDHLLTKYFYDEPFDIVDLYGSFLANELFAEKAAYKQRQTLSSQAERIRMADIPFPIYTAIAAESIAAEELWYEFTPYEVGAAWLNAWVPSWAFGRKFKDGISVNFAPEQNFGILMGTFGLAIGISVARLIQEIGFKVDREFVKNIVDRIVQEHGERRITSSDFLNFSYGMPNNKMADKRILKLVDAGINFNLPYPAISGERSERKADIIVFIDASGDNLAQDLRRAQEYARARNLKFPEIDYTNIDKKAVSVFKNEQDPQVPVVIYIPRVVDQSLPTGSLKNFDVEACIKSGPCSTFNFKYTDVQARALTALGSFNVVAAKDAFKQAVALKVGHAVVR